MKIIDLDSEPFHSLPYRTSGPGGQFREAELPFYHAVADELENGPLVFTSDLQGRVEGELLGVALAKELEFLVELNELSPIQGIAVCGDLYDDPELRKLGASGEVAEVFDALSEIASLVGVLGNHDRLEVKPERATILDGDLINWNGMRVGGVSGIIGNPSRPMRKDLKDFRAQVKKVLAGRPDLLLLHHGPCGNGNNQLGAPEVNTLLPKTREMLVACGHCHWMEPIAELNPIQVLNVDARVVVIDAIKE